jgi:hypothetical protein
MPWTSLFPEPILLKDGRSITTLGQARALMLNLPFRNQNRPHWRHADELLLDAAANSGSIEHAFHQMIRALTADGLMQ